MWRDAMLVGVGGFAGAVARYALSDAVHRVSGLGLPLGTFAANVLGCLAIGFILHLALERGQIGPAGQLLIVTGFLGSFTTFSTFGHETMTLWRDGRMMHAAANVAANVSVCLFAVALGWWAGSLVPVARAEPPLPPMVAPAVHTDRSVSGDTGPGRAVEGRLMFEARSIKAGGRTYLYRRSVPPGEGPHPAIVFLHGMGESGEDNAAQLKQGLPLEVARQPEAWPFVVIAAQKPDPRSQWEDHAEAVFAMLDTAVADGLVDPGRVALTGLSQGGHGTWTLNALEPERFRALFVVCGYTDLPDDPWNQDLTLRHWTFDPYSEVVRRIVDAAARKPVWIAHGDADPVVPASESVGPEALLRARQAAAGTPAAARVRLDLYPRVGHNAWDRAYSADALAEWFIEHTR